ncbi:3-methyladenine DNA glycosylase AlkD [Ruminococcus flavefaciens]|uniref:3-methyladenine DNA glycosylase AlkD n=1 Tax=Ruminococcus flavefaciens TaxID=1265 RepID=A0A1H6HUM8_RUMFL|nr:DNA alkylation repair protein [Ruminococcus flavefaciens]SEH37723.1 3-methyladenine DNA glycosylase AlkD [Ruminococcus flavefaciens]
MYKFNLVKEMFENAQNPENAAAMSAYMKNKFNFYGIPSPERKELNKDFLKSEKASKNVDWDFLDKCYKDDHREMQYLVYDYLLALKKYLAFEDIDKIKLFIITRSWWDTIDFLCKIIGDIGLRDNRVSELMLKWSVSDNIWLKRTAILHQLAYKRKTDTELLEKVICNCLGSDEFFINKAIGWALREYSKTVPEWVGNFISKYKNELSALSIKEASKYI